MGRSDGALQPREAAREPVDARDGASWLYNIDAYRRLFPASYLATAQVVEGRFQHMPLWGQFVNRHGETNEDMQRRFLDRLERQSSLDGLDRASRFRCATEKELAQRRHALAPLFFAGQDVITQYRLVSEKT